MMSACTGAASGQFAVRSGGTCALLFKVPTPSDGNFSGFPMYLTQCPVQLTTHDCSPHTYTHTVHCVGIKPRGISCRFILMNRQSFRFFSVYNFCCCASDIICLLRHWWTSVCFSTRTLIHTQQISTDGRKK